MDEKLDVSLNDVSEKPPVVSSLKNNQRFGKNRIIIAVAMLVIVILGAGSLFLIR